MKGWKAFLHALSVIAHGGRDPDTLGAVRQSSQVKASAANYAARQAHELGAWIKGADDAARFMRELDGQ